MTPNPALVTQQAAQRLPRLALLLLCAAYVLPGLLGRDPWRGADLTAFGQMLALAEGRTPWLAPALGGVPTGAALLPHWVGALAIQALQPWMDPALAARLPFAGLLVLTLVAVWYATFHLARSDAAQPLPLAFGGEASPVDYARAIADGALLAFIATLGLLQLGHETTPELAQLAAAACLLWALAAVPHRPGPARAVLLLALPALAASGAPAMAVAWGLGGMALAIAGTEPALRRLWPWLTAATLLAAGLAWASGSWAWRVQADLPWAGLARLWLWFLWPAWPLALWTLWGWRRQWMAHHLAVPGLGLLVPLLACLAMGGSDRALMLGLPGISVLAAFALPTLQRSASAAIDWFSVFFFSLCAATVWVFFLGLQTGLPHAARATVERLAPGFQPQPAGLPLLLAALATLAWLWLVRWRTRRHRPALWKSLVLPASGVALNWLLLMTLSLPLLDYARSNRALVQRLMRHVPAGACVAAPGASTSLVAALEFHGRHAVDARDAASDGACPALVLVLVERGPGQARSARQAERLRDLGWREVARERGPTDRRQVLLVLRRAPGTALAQGKAATRPTTAVQ